MAAPEAPDVQPEAPEAPVAPKHPVDRRPPLARLAAFGFQHVLIMYTGCITVPLVFGAAAGLDRSTIGLLINADLLVAGLITLVQSLGVGKVLGIRLPIVTGATFASVTPMILIAGEYGMPAVYGSMLAAGLFGLVVAVPFARLVRFFPPLVSGVVITVVGLSLIGVAGGLITGNDPKAPDYASPARLALAAGVLVAIVLFARFARGFLGQVGILAAIVLGTLAAVPLGLTDFSGAAGADWFGTAAPFHFGAPEFPASAVISMCVVMLVIFTESTATMMAVGEATGREVTDKDLARGLAADGLSGVLGGAMNSFMDTVFTQNVGLLRLTGVSSRYVTAAAGGMLLVLGLVPRLGELVAALPGPVVGAAGLMLFATVTMVGINTLRRVDLDRGHNLTIAAVALGAGLLPELAEGVYDRFPSWVQIILGSGITSAALVAFLLNLLFHHTGRIQHSRPEPIRRTIEASDPTEPDGEPDAEAQEPGKAGKAGQETPAGEEVREPARLRD
ncbi:xanthine/uracil permease [Streptomyces spiroverticillatus]|uniref:Xanthine/uracil permease n=1 Tax=Streptomyces finlayi TaxID=67296 RepID=A0A918WVW0_9ACTN|nr:nucleobase:cation symporter-2 family protein [Streptomyces finlayi]GHA02865.1 xanthine/uracil permease [Streptomyces spiroverticillatus]GHC87097.1 xanthine/uracil permease [Streptomyces finlayi]